MADSSNLRQSRYAACAQRSQSVGWSSSTSTHLSTLIQELAMPVLSAGTDAVLAAETGSGKTICYLAPVIAQLLQLKQSHNASPSISRCVRMQHDTLQTFNQQSPETDCKLLPASTDFSCLFSAVSTPHKSSIPSRTLAATHVALATVSVTMHVLCSDREGIITPGALVLCPNAALCNQVKLVADSLTDLDGKPLLETAHVSNSTPPPFTVPDIVVTTPASLINITEASHYGPEWTKGGILARYAYLLGYSHTG